MGSITGLRKGAFTSIDNSGEIRLGNTLNSGTAGQALVSGGPNAPARWDIHTGTINPLTMGSNVSLLSGNPSFDGSIADTLNSVDTTYTAGNGIQISGSNNIQTKTDNQTIRDSGGGSGNQLEVIKVPNDLTFTGYATGTFNGSAPLTINLVNTEYTAGDGIVIGGTTIEANIDEDTIDFNAGTMEVQKVPNALSAGTNLSFSSGTTFDGSSARTINLNASLTSIDSITMTSTPSAGGTSLTGNNYPAAGYQTPMTYFNLLSSTNIVSPYFLHDVYDPLSADSDALTTIHTEIFSGNLKNSFTAQSTSCCIELLIYNFSITGNKYMYIQLGDNKLVEWSIGATADGGGVATGSRSTNRTMNYTDETDKLPVSQTWYLSGLSVGTSYTINPMARTSGTVNYIYAGGSFPACILRGYYLN